VLLTLRLCLKKTKFIKLAHGKRLMRKGICDSISKESNCACLYHLAADYEHVIFANWVIKAGVLGNAFLMFLTLVAAFAVPVIIVTTQTTPEAAQKLVLFAYFSELSYVSDRATIGTMPSW